TEHMEVLECARREPVVTHTLAREDRARLDRLDRETEGAFKPLERFAEHASDRGRQGSEVLETRCGQHTRREIRTHRQGEWQRGRVAGHWPRLQGEEEPEIGD